MAIIQTAGLIFPVTLTAGRHTVDSGAELIQSSIKMILSWPIFTRQYEDSFGSRLYELLEEPNDDILINLVRRFVVDSLEMWEKRINLVYLDITRPSFGKLSIELVYLVKELNIEDSFYYTYDIK